MPKDYYLILGITSEATPDDIKDAYRRLAKEFHPDYYGDNHSPFLAIQEAYSVLSDPVKRQTHDRETLNRKKKWLPRYRERIRPAPRRQVEPLIPDQEEPMDLGTASFTRSFQPHRPPLDPIPDGIFSHFRQAFRPKKSPLENLNLVIPLTPEQAFQGGRIRVAMPVQRNCPSCSGQRRLGVYGCRQCNGEGKLSGEYPVMITYPSGISENHSVHIPLNRYGMGDRCLTVYFRIYKMQ